jgi:hypothetical protein
MSKARIGGAFSTSDLVFPPAVHLRDDHRTADAVFPRQPCAALPDGIGRQGDAAAVYGDARTPRLCRQILDRGWGVAGARRDGL